MERFGLVGLPNAASPRCSTRSPAATRAWQPAPLLDDRDQRRRRQVPDERLVRLAEMSSSSQGRARQRSSSSTSPGWPEGLVARARASATGSSAASARSTPSATCCGPSRTTTSRATPTRSTTSTTLELELVLADAAAAEAQLDKRRKAARSDKSLAGEVAALEARHRPPADGTPLYRAGLDATSTGRCCGPTSCSPPSRSLAVVNLGEDQLDDRRRRRGAGAERARRRRPRCSACRVQLEAEAARSTPRSGPSCSKGWAWARARCPASSAPPTTCSGCGRSSRPGDKESRAWTFRAGAKAPGVRGRHPLRPPARLHPGRGDPLGRAAGDRLVGQGQGPRASCASRARTTRSSTATCWRSASTSEPQLKSTFSSCHAPRGSGAHPHGAQAEHEGEQLAVGDGERSPEAVGAPAREAPPTGFAPTVANVNRARTRPRIDGNDWTWTTVLALARTPSWPSPTSASGISAHHASGEHARSPSATRVHEGHPPQEGDVDQVLRASISPPASAPMPLTAQSGVEPSLPPRPS